MKEIEQLSGCFDSTHTFWSSLNATAETTTDRRSTCQTLYEPCSQYSVKSRGKYVRRKTHPYSTCNREGVFVAVVVVSLNVFFLTGWERWRSAVRPEVEFIVHKRNLSLSMAIAWCADHYVFCFYFHIIALLLLFCLLCPLLHRRIILWMAWSVVPFAQNAVRVFSLIIRIDVPFIFFTTLHHHKTHDMAAWVRRAQPHTQLSDWKFMFLLLIAARIYINFWSLFEQNMHLVSLE